MSFVLRWTRVVVRDGAKKGKCGSWHGSAGLSAYRYRYRTRTLLGIDECTTTE